MLVALAVQGGAVAADAEVPAAPRPPAFTYVDPNTWEVTLSGTIQAIPRYPGAADYTVVGYPGIDIRRVGEPRRFSAPDDNFSFTVYDSDNGTVGTVAADYLLPVDRWLFSVGPRFNIGDASFARTYFGVSPVEAAINGHVMPYNPGSFYSAGLLAAVTYHQSEAWSYTTFGGYSRILGASGESPLVDRPYGNPNQFTLGLRIDYTFRTKPLL